MKSAEEHIGSIRARNDDHESHGCARHQFRMACRGVIFLGEK